MLRYVVVRAARCWQPCNKVVTPGAPSRARKRPSRANQRPATRKDGGVAGGVVVRWMVQSRAGHASASSGAVPGASGTARANARRPAPAPGDHAV